MNFTAEFMDGNRRDIIINFTDSSPDYETQVDALRIELERVLQDVLTNVYPSFWDQLRLQVEYKKDTGEKEKFW